MISNISVIQGAVVAIANLGFFSFFAISIQNNSAYGSSLRAGAIVLTWASMYAVLMLISVYLVYQTPKSVDNFRAATVLSSFAIIVGFGSVVLSVVFVGVTALSALVLLIGIRLRAAAPSRP